MNYDDLVKGALLHDIWKIIQRAREGEINPKEEGFNWLRRKGIPEEVSVFACPPSQVDKMDFAEGEEGDLSLEEKLLIVEEADKLSSGEIERTGEENSGEFVPLRSIFSRISFDQNAITTSTEHSWKYYSLNCSQTDIPFPTEYDSAVDNSKPEAYASLLRAFENELDLLLPELSIDGLLTLLEKYSSDIPWKMKANFDQPEDHPDISLFDHLKNTAAFAACLYKYCSATYQGNEKVSIKEVVTDRQDMRYMLVGGDFSGIQQFIYTISSKGALKTLRARSFFLELLTEHAITRLLSVMDLPRTNIIYSGGGRFFLLAPNLPSCRQALRKIDLEINDYLYNSLPGDIFLALGFVEFSGNTFLKSQKAIGTDIGEVWGQLGDFLAAKKRQKYLAQMQSDPESFWALKEPNDKICSICQMSVGDTFQLFDGIETDESFEVCIGCKEFFKLGNELPKAKYIAVSYEKSSEVPSFKIENTCYFICETKEQLSEINPNMVYVLNSWEIEDFRNRGMIPLFVGNYASLGSKGYKDFDTMAQEALGANRIGILRMDVDYLGKVFTAGLPKEIRTFSRLSTLSRRLTQFFKFHINSISRGDGTSFTPFKLVPGNSKRNVSIVYSGGDDLFIVGSWNDIIELAFDIEWCFRQYTGQNPDLTISGGVVVEDPKYPLYKLAEMAGEAEERAKDNGRDSVSLFNVYPVFSSDGEAMVTGVYKWTEARRLTETIVTAAVENFSSKVESYLQFEFSKSFLQRIGQISEIWRREGILSLPKFAYILGQETKRIDSNKSISDEKKGIWKHFQTQLYDLSKLAFLNTAVTWLDLLSRKEN